MRDGLAGGSFTEEIVFLEGGETRVRVAAANEAELIRVSAELGFELKAVLERGAGIFEFEHRFRLLHAPVEVAKVPGLVVGELVVG